MRALLSILPRTFQWAALAVAFVAFLVAAGPVMAARAAPERRGSALSSCQSQPVPGDAPVSIQSGGLAREAVLYLPPSASRGRQLPLVVALHGAGGNGSKMEAYSGLDAVADRYGFAVVYPSAVPPRPFWNYTEDRDRADDVTFIADLIVSLRDRLCMDTTRVYATGISNGGSMATRLACRLSGTFAAVAPVAGSYARQPDCAPDNPVSLLVIHGTRDGSVPYAVVPPFMQAAAARNGCSPTPTQRALARRTRQFEWRGCAGGSRVAEIRVWNGVHQWPGGFPSIRSPISAQDVVWRFFSALRTPGPASP